MLKKIIMIVSVAVWLPSAVILPLMSHGESTSRNISVEVLAQPFKENPALIYKWEGEVYRSCPIEIRRRIVDSHDVVTTLRALSFGAVPKTDLGQSSYEIKVDVPLFIPDGPATYYATEIPRCSWVQRLWPKEHPYPPVKFDVTR